MAMWRWKLSRGCIGTDVVFRDFVVGIELWPTWGHFEFLCLTEHERYVQFGPVTLFLINVS
jgi:hypothetical protein